MALSGSSTPDRRSRPAGYQLAPVPDPSKSARDVVQRSLEIAADPKNKSAKRQIDQEYPVPGQILGQGASQDWTQWYDERGDRCPGTDRPAPVLWRETGVQKRKTGWRKESRRRTLQRAGEDDGGR